MKDHGNGFLALILTGILVMIIGLSLMVPAARSPAAVRSGLAEQPSPTLAMRIAGMTPIMR